MYRHFHTAALLSTLRTYAVIPLTVILFLSAPVFPGYPNASAAVVINELFPKPSDEVSEWIEVYNTGPATVRLEGWRLENAAGDRKTFVIPPGSEIPAGGYLTFFQSQTGISLFNEGDSVSLRNTENTEVDSQGYPSTLGYNTSMGRSIDGAGLWTVCSTHTYNQPNNCPPPPPTATPIPTPLPSLSATPTITPSDTVAITPSANPFPEAIVTTPSPAAVVLSTVPTAPSPPAAPSPQEPRSSVAAAFLLGIAASLTLTGLGIFIYRKRQSRTL